jgi:hypothetical protein
VLVLFCGHSNSLKFFSLFFFTTGNQLTDEGGKALLEALKVNTSLQVILLWSNSISSDIQKSLNDCLALRNE